jgi:hypothetical protein
MNGGGGGGDDGGDGGGRPSRRMNGGGGGRPSRRMNGGGGGRPSRRMNGGQGGDGDREGMGGREGALFDVFRGTIDYSNSTCPSSTTTGSGPECSYPSKGGEGGTGTWVCRSLNHPVKDEKVIATRCIDPEFSVATDACGCCTDTGCPQECSCTCGGDDDGGVLIEITHTDPDTGETEVKEKCVDSAEAVSAIAHDGDIVSCSTTCN